MSGFLATLVILVAAIAAAFWQMNVPVVQAVREARRAARGLTYRPQHRAGTPAPVILAAHRRTVVRPRTAGNRPQMTLGAAA